MSAGPRIAQVRKSEVATILGADAGVTDLLGWSPEDLVGKSSLEFVHPDDHQLAIDSWMQMLDTRRRPQAVRLRHRHRDGCWVWVDLTNHNLLEDAECCVVAEMVEVQGLAPEEPSPAAAVHGAVAGAPSRRVHETLRDREYIVHRLAEALPLGVLQFDAHGRVTYSNRMLHTILGVERAATMTEQLAGVVAEERGMLDEALGLLLERGIDNEVELHVATPGEDGEKDLRLCTVTLRALLAEDERISGGIACVADVTETVRIREELRMRATFDAVTTCYNRAAVLEALARELDAAVHGHPPAVIYIDLDRFKAVNDRFGHGAGDELLTIVGRRLLGAVRRGDLVGRLGGDEFLVVCPRIASPGQALRAANRLAEALRHPVRLEVGEVACRASIGIAWPGDRRADADSLVHWADAAMYEAKRRGSVRAVLGTGPPL